MKNKFLSIVCLLLSFLGFLDSTYLTIIHYKNIAAPCSITHGCETVLTSQYATIGPIPIALIGSLFYVTVMILLGLKIINSQLYALRPLPYALPILISASLLVSMVLLYLQAFVLHAFCQFCLGVEAINILLFIGYGIPYVWTKKSQLISSPQTST
jgi:uncharacterized membrane protein